MTLLYMRHGLIQLPHPILHVSLGSLAKTTITQVRYLILLLMYIAMVQPVLCCPCGHCL